MRDILPEATPNVPLTIQFRQHGGTGGHASFYCGPIHSDHRFSRRCPTAGLRGAKPGFTRLAKSVTNRPRGGLRTAAPLRSSPAGEKQSCGKPIGSSGWPVWDLPLWPEAATGRVVRALPAEEVLHPCSDRRTPRRRRSRPWRMPARSARPPRGHPPLILPMISTARAHPPRRPGGRGGWPGTTKNPPRAKRCRFPPGSTRWRKTTIRTGEAAGDMPRCSRLRWHAPEIGGSRLARPRPRRWQCPPAEAKLRIREADGPPGRLRGRTYSGMETRQKQRRRVASCKLQLPASTDN